MKARWVVKDKITGEYLTRMVMDSCDNTLVMDWNVDRKDAIRFINIAMADGARTMVDQHNDVAVFRIK